MKDLSGAYLGCCIGLAALDRSNANGGFKIEAVSFDPAILIALCRLGSNSGTRPRDAAALITVNAEEVDFCSEPGSISVVISLGVRDIDFVSKPGRTAGLISADGKDVDF